MPPESGISDNDLQSILAIISLLFDNFPGKDLVTCIHRSWITDDNILPFSSFGLFRPNGHLWIVQFQRMNRERSFVNLHLRKYQSSFING